MKWQSRVRTINGVVYGLRASDVLRFTAYREGTPIEHALRVIVTAARQREVEDDDSDT